MRNFCHPLPRDREGGQAALRHLQVQRPQGLRTPSLGVERGGPEGFGSVGLGRLGAGRLKAERFEASVSPSAASTPATAFL